MTQAAQGAIRPGPASGSRAAPLQIGLPGMDAPSESADRVSASAYAAMRRSDVLLAALTLEREGFAAWLALNYRLWQCFERNANAIWDRGRRHYSARTLWEVMRHETALAEVDPTFKLNNNHAPSMARLYLALYPEREGFFETREIGMTAVPPAIASGRGRASPGAQGATPKPLAAQETALAANSQDVDQ